MGKETKPEKEVVYSTDASKHSYKDTYGNLKEIKTKNKDKSTKVDVTSGKGEVLPTFEITASKKGSILYKNSPKHHQHASNLRMDGMVHTVNPELSPEDAWGVDPDGTVTGTGESTPLSKGGKLKKWNQKRSYLKKTGPGDVKTDSTKTTSVGRATSIKPASMDLDKLRQMVEMMNKSKTENRVDKTKPEK